MVCPKEAETLHAAINALSVVSSKNLKKNTKIDFQVKSQGQNVAKI